MITPPLRAGAPMLTARSTADLPLMEKARELEATFLSEMLKHAGLDDNQGGYFGSAGEDQFGSFLRDAQARQMVDQGGIGLAESLFQSLTRMQNGQG